MQNQPKRTATIKAMLDTVRVDAEKGLVPAWLITYVLQDGSIGTIQIDKAEHNPQTFAERVKAQEKARTESFGLVVEL